MPVIGLVTAEDWRWGWIALPLASAVCAAAAVSRRRPDPAPAAPARTHRALARDQKVARWAMSEFLTYTAWGAVLVYTGAYLLDTYELSPGAAGLVLGAAAAGYFPGTLLARRSVERHARAMLVGFGLAAAATVIAFTTIRLSLVESAALLGLLMSAIGARTIAAGAFDLHASPDRRAALMGIRAAAIQFGNLLGAAAGGIAIAVSGYAALGLMAGALFALAVVPHLNRPRAILPERLIPPPRRHELNRATFVSTSRASAA